MTTPNPRPSFPTEEKHFHPFAALRFLRKTLAVYLIPLVNVLFERNWPAFWTALRQDAILFALLCGVSWVILRFSSWQLDEAGVLHLRWKLLFKLDTTIRGEALAALTLERPALFRLGGATKITLYPTGQPRKHVIPLCLRRPTPGSWRTACSPLKRLPSTPPPGVSGPHWYYWEPTAFPRWRWWRWPSGRHGSSRWMLRRWRLPILGIWRPLQPGGCRRRGLAADAGNGTVRGQFGTQLCPGRALRGLAHGNADREPGRLDQSL